MEVLLAARLAMKIAGWWPAYCWQVRACSLLPLREKGWG